MKAPAGYVLVEDPGLQGFQAPPGYRLMKRRHCRVRPAPSGKTNLGGVKAGEEYLKRLRALVATLKAEHPQGTLIEWSRSNTLPRSLAEAFYADPRWAWAPTAGGFIRLAPAPLPAGTDLLAYRPGDFTIEDRRSRLWGFTSVGHGKYARIRVRLPEGREFWVEKVREMADPTPELEAWLKTATISEMQAWVQGGGQ